jgi:hypothetical protein
MRNIYQPIALLLAFTCVSLTSLAQSQTGPGGVGTTSTIAYWFDASTLSFSNNDPVDTWSDISGNENDATQADVTRRPLYISTSALNSMPVVRFSNDFIATGSINSINSNVVSWFSASQYTGGASAGDKGMMTTRTSSRLNLYGQGVNVNEYFNFVQTPYTPNSAVFPLSVPRIHTSRWSSAGNFDFWMNGFLIANKTGLVPGASTHLSTVLGAYSSGLSPFVSNFWNGDIAEIFAYNFTTNLTQNTLISNYLSTKYGIPCNTLDRYAYEATHSFELAGIGRTNASDQHLSARGTSIVEFTAASLSDDDFLLWAHNNDPFTTDLVNVPPSYIATVGERMTRTWRIAETGSTGNVTISFDLTGIMFGHPDDFQLLIDADGDFTSGTTTVAGTLVFNTVSFTVTGAQLNDGDFFTVANTNASVIRSVVSGQDWNQTSTWSCGSCIPSSTSYVVISDNHIVNISDNQNAARVTVNSNAELSIASSGTLNLSEHLNVIGTINSDPAGTINFIGTALQTVNTNGTINFGSLVVNNLNDVQLQTGNYTQSGVLNLINGDLDLGGNRYTFLSSASGTASIDEMTVAGTILNMGDVRVQRFIPSGVAGYRNIGTPLTMMPLSEWDDELFISGPGFPDGCAFSSSGCYRSARFWNASTQAYVGISDINELIMNGTAIEIWLGDNLTSFGQTTLQASGELDVSISKNISILPGWNLISNPFLSPIDFDDIVRNTGTGNYHYVWDPAHNGFDYWDGAAQSASDPMLANGNLSAFQGFWMFHTGGSTSITINQNAKRAGDTDLFLRQQNISKLPNYLSIELSNTDKGYKATAGVKFSDEFYLNFDDNDLPKLPNHIVDGKAMSIYSKTNDDFSVVVNSLPLLDECFKLPIYFDVTIEGNYKLKFNSLPKDYNVILLDKFSGKKVLLSEGIEYEFIQFDQLTDVNRFELNFDQGKKCIETNKFIDPNINITAINSKTVQISFSETPNDYNIEIYNLMGQRVYTSNLITDQSTNYNFQTELKGMYIIKLVATEGTVLKTQKLVLGL